MVRVRIVVTAVFVACLFGCGGGGGGGGDSQQGTFVPMRVAIRWAARSRDLSAPSAALSAAVTLARASADGGDASFIVKRRRDPAAYTEVASSPSPVRVGVSPLTVRFYAQDNGGGSLVGQADAEVLLQSDGSLVQPDGSPLGDIVTYGTIATIEVTPGQTVLVGQDQVLTFTARDAANNVLAITPGSVFFTLQAGVGFLSVDASGNAHGIASGTATVVANVDVRQSPPQMVLVTTPIQIRRLNFQANDIAYEPKSGKLFASVSSGDVSGHGNGIMVIDPSTATITNSVAVGSEANRIAISDDGHYLYVGLDLTGAVRRVDLQTMKADLQFTLGSDSILGTRYCRDIAVMPGSPHTVAVSMRYTQVSPDTAGVAIFDDGVQRTNTVDGRNYADWIAFGATPGRLYGCYYYGDLSRMTVDANGISLVDYRQNIVGTDNQIQFFGGALYSSGGHAADPESYSLLGTYNPGPDGYALGTTNGFTVDLGANRAYYLAYGFNSSFLTLYGFDRSQFLKISTHFIPISSDYSERNVVPRMVLCGGGRLAFNVHGGQHPELGQVVIVSPGG
jgi:hypothetical protein